MRRMSRKRMNRKCMNRFCSVIVACSLESDVADAFAQAFPVLPVRIINPMDHDGA